MKEYIWCVYKSNKNSISAKINYIKNLSDSIKANSSLKYSKHFMLKVNKLNRNI